jgi:hypothetical protein
VQKLENDTWMDVENINADSYSAWRHSTQFKMLGNLLDEFQDNRKQLADRFLHLKCKEFDIPPGTPMRLEYEYYIIPRHEVRHTRAWWNAWRPNPQRYIGFETFCP